MAIGFAVLVKDERDTDDKGADDERNKLEGLRDEHRGAPALGDGRRHRQSLREEVGEGDVHEGTSAHEEDDRDLDVAEGVLKGQHDDGADDGRQSGEEVVEERLHIF